MFMIRPMNIDQHAASAHTTQTDPSGDRAAGCAHCSDVAAEMVERHRRMLMKMGEVGMDLIAAMQRRAKDDDHPETMDQLNLGFARVTRAVRLTMAYEARLLEDSEARRERIAAEAAKRQRHRAEEALWRRVDRRYDQVQHLAEAAIERKVEEGEIERSEAVSLYADLRERLEDEDFEYELENSSIEELLPRICRHLGIEPDPSVWRYAVWNDGNEEPDSEPSAQITGSGRDPPKRGSG
jgi:hypothetical protein